MNNLKKTSIALFVVAVVLIVIGNSVLVYSLVNNDSEDMKKLEENLTTSLDKFKIKVDNFSEARDEYSKVVENDLFIETVEETVKSGDKVQLIGFGTFEAKTRAARTGKNPRTGEAIKIAESKVPAFKAGAAFKDLINK